jgi:hypothetical protein
MQLELPALLPGLKQRLEHTQYPKRGYIHFYNPEGLMIDDG